MGINMSDPKVWEYWSTLAKSDPARFASERRAVALEAISRAPKRQQENLLRLQNRIDAACMGDPIASLFRLEEMMGERLMLLTSIWLDFGVAISMVNVWDDSPTGETRIMGRLKYAT